MKRANLEGASLKNCKFETVSSSANFGANLEGTIFIFGFELYLIIIKTLYSLCDVSIVGDSL